jgi:hypothetical protein
MTLNSIEAPLQRFAVILNHVCGVTPATSPAMALEAWFNTIGNRCTIGYYAGDLPRRTATDASNAEIAGPGCGHFPTNVLMM